MSRRRAFSIVAGLAVLALGGCVSGLAVLAWVQPNSVTLPAPTGPFRVGRTSHD